MEGIGVKLEKIFSTSADHMNMLQAANNTIQNSTDRLEQNSISISDGADSVSASFHHVQHEMLETADSIHSLNDDVHRFENVLNENRANMTEMSAQMHVVRETMDETDRVFRILSDQMKKIASVTGEINQIATNTGLLSVNASIEAARAGEAGKGFAVVAANVRELSVNSTRSSNEIADVVSSMQKQIDNTTMQLADSLYAIAVSAETLHNLQTGFNEMIQQFGNLYDNIETQNTSITEVSHIFDELKDRVSNMSLNSGENHTSVDSITEMIRVYRNNITAVIEDNRQIRMLSEQILELAKGHTENEESA